MGSSGLAGHYITCLSHYGQGKERPLDLELPLTYRVTPERVILLNSYFLADTGAVKERS